MLWIVNSCSASPMAKTPPVHAGHAHAEGVGRGLGQGGDVVGHPPLVQMTEALVAGRDDRLDLEVGGEGSGRDPLGRRPVVGSVAVVHASPRRSMPMRHTTTPAPRTCRMVRPARYVGSPTSVRSSCVIAGSSAMPLRRWRSHTLRSFSSSGESLSMRNWLSERGLVEVDADVVGRPDREVGPRGAQHGPQRDLGRRDQVDVCLDRQLQHELAVLALADLQEGALVRGTDVVALGIHQEDVGRLVPDVAAEDERCRAVGPHLAERFFVPGRHLPAQAPEVQRRLEEMADRGQALGPLSGRQVAAPCGRGPPGWWPGSRPTQSRTGGRRRAGARASCGRCRRRRRPRSCGCRPGRACPRGGAGPGSRSTASSSLRAALVGGSDGRPANIPVRPNGARSRPGGAGLCL